MATSLFVQPASSKNLKEEVEETYKQLHELSQTLPKSRGWTSEHILLYKGFWMNPNIGLKAALLMHNHYKARSTDIFLAAFLKCGTTWLRALIFSTMNRSIYDFASHPLLKTGPHGCFPFLDIQIYSEEPIKDFENLPSPRLLATHIPYSLFPQSVLASRCKFVYIWRDAKDVLISMWYFMNKVKPVEVVGFTLEQAFESFCVGAVSYGPFWDHVLEYWKASQESLGNEILFLKYEDLKREPVVWVKKLAQFLGHPFTEEEESEGMVEKIVGFCSFKNLSNLEINKTGIERFNGEFSVENHNFFRKGEVGDGRNHLTEEMIDRLDKITKNKFRGTGLIEG